MLLGKFRVIFPIILLKEHILQHLLTMKNLWKKWGYSPYQQVSLPDVFNQCHDSWPVMTPCRTHHWGRSRSGVGFLKSTWCHSGHSPRGPLRLGGEKLGWRLKDWWVEGWKIGVEISVLEDVFGASHHCKTRCSYLKFFFSKNKGCVFVQISDWWCWWSVFLFLVCLASHFVGRKNPPNTRRFRTTGRRP